MIEKVARAIATANGDDYDKIPLDKYDWRSKRGLVDGQFRDVNSPHQTDYDGMAEAAIEAMREPEAEMLGHGDDAIFYSDFDHRANACWKAMIEAALSEEKAE